MFSELSNETRHASVGRRDAPDRIEIRRRSLDLRYHGLDAWLNDA